MKASVLSTHIALILASGFASIGSAQATGKAGSLDGQWDAVLLNNGPAVPFRLDITGTGPTLKGTFYDGFKPYDSTTSATYQDNKLILKAEHYLTTISATLQDGELAG